MENRLCFARAKEKGEEMKTFLKWIFVPISAIIVFNVISWFFSFAFDWHCGKAISSLARKYTFGGHPILVIEYILGCDILSSFATTITIMHFAPKYKKILSYILLSIIIISFVFIIFYANIQYVVKAEENIILILNLISAIIGCVLAIKYYKEDC